MAASQSNPNHIAPPVTQITAATPQEERNEPSYGFGLRDRSTSSPKRSGDEEGTVVDEEEPLHHPHPPSPKQRARRPSHLNVDTEVMHSLDDIRSMQSPSRVREESHRLDDDLTVLKVERQISAQISDAHSNMGRSKSRREEPPDDFDMNDSPAYEKTSVYKPPKNPNTNIGKIFKKIHNSFWLVRYFIYIIPVATLILIPILLGYYLFDRASVGGVRLMWFCIWLEIVWLSLWAGRILAKCLPWPIGAVSSMFTNNSKKWRDMGKQLEIPATLFFWGLACEVSFLPVMTSKHLDGTKDTKHWEGVMNKVIIAIFIALILNFAEKILIQLIAISFHLRTYSDRIEVNKFQIDSLVKLYQFSKGRLVGVSDKEFAEKSGTASGARTPALLREAQENAGIVINRIGDIAGKVAGDFTGKKIASSGHPGQVVLALLSTTEGSQALARRLYRTFCNEHEDTVNADDLRSAFENDDEADAAFTMFDKDLNGDISMEELEAVCVEIGRERKSITASLKDLDSVISKLDDVFIFIICVITILVFISLISTSAAGVLTSAGSAVLALSWLFSATAQEFLQSIIFVFVKHPFDVGDRVSIYGNTGATLQGDDYFVKEISLLYTEFKKMEGHVVQAPNSYLNTLFILNQRRSGGLAEAVPVIFKFGTTLEQIESLRGMLLEFVSSEKREYQSKILTELRQVTEAHSITLNVIFFYKSNWQNELLRLQRRNKFFCALMVAMQECGIEGPRMRYPGQKESFPVYLQNVPHAAATAMGGTGAPGAPGGANAQQQQPNPEHYDPPFVDDGSTYPSGIGGGAASSGKVPQRNTSILRDPSRRRGESFAQLARKVDFSLGMKDISSGDITGDVFDDRARLRLPPRVSSPAGSSRASGEGRRSIDQIGVGRSTSTTHGGGRARGGSVNSRVHPLQRIATDSSQERATHRNRFWGRGRAGEGDVEAAMEDIPEKSERLDPRSGRVSPQAVSRDREEGEEVGLYDQADPRAPIRQTMSGESRR